LNIEFKHDRLNIQTNNMIDVLLRLLTMNFPKGGAHTAAAQNRRCGAQIVTHTYVRIQCISFRPYLAILEGPVEGHVDITW